MGYSITPGAKMMYLIKRREGTSREELVAHWYANHMPAVIASQAAASAKGHPSANRYQASLFDADKDGNHVWDGVAQLWWDEVTPKPAEPHGTNPADTFQQHAQPYVPWATTEYLLIDGNDRLPVEPLTLNDPFPCSRSGFVKYTAMVGAKPGTDFDAMFAHWLDVHGPNVVSMLEDTGGWHYALSLSVDPANEPFAGMAEIYFDDAAGCAAFEERLGPDGFEEWVDHSTTLVLTGSTEFIGIAG